MLKSIFFLHISSLWKYFFNSTQFIQIYETYFAEIQTITGVELNGEIRLIFVKLLLTLEVKLRKNW